MIEVYISSSNFLFVTKNRWLMDIWSTHLDFLSSLYKVIVFNSKVQYHKLVSSAMKSSDGYQLNFLLGSPIKTVTVISKSSCRRQNKCLGLHVHKLPPLRFCYILIYCNPPI